MKASRYNFLWNDREKNFAFNAANGMFAALDDKAFELLKCIMNSKEANISETDRELVERLHFQGFIVDDNIDEIKSVEENAFSKRYSPKSLRIAVAPTLNCNFKCFYCYQERDKRNMPDEVMAGINKFADRFLEGMQNLSVSWIGGEPLVAKGVIWRLSESLIKTAGEKGCSYGASMVTNGYLLDGNVIKKLIEYKVRKVQVTLDGPPDVHDRRRIFHDGSGTFETIVNNVKSLMKLDDISVSIRVNIDMTNFDKVHILLDILKKYGITNADIYPGKLIDYSDNNAFEEICFSSGEYAGRYVGFMNMLKKREMKVSDILYRPPLKRGSCGANTVNSFVIDHMGYIYKCRHLLGEPEEACGNVLNPDDRNLENYMEWMDYSPFVMEECRTCKVLPLCMGGCCYETVKFAKKPECSIWKYNLMEFLKDWGNVSEDI